MFRNFSPLRILIPPRNQVQIRRFLIPWNLLEVFSLKIPFSPISTIDFLSDLIKFEDYVKKFLNFMWIQPIFTIIPLNSSEFPNIGKFGIIFDAIPREIDDLRVSSHHSALSQARFYSFVQLHHFVVVCDALFDALQYARPFKIHQTQMNKIPYHYQHATS